MIRPLACVVALLLAAPALRARDAKEEKGDKPLLEVKGKLTDDDPKDKVIKPSPCKTYPFKMKKGEIYVIDMVSTEIDSFLRLENPDGKQVALDDDGGGDPNAHIGHKARETGEYKIIATCYPWMGKGKYAMKGNFILTVRPGTEEDADRFFSLYGKPAPPIVGVTVKGKAKKLASYKGKVVLVDFWAVWCGPCLATFPHLRDWKQKYGKDGLRILGVTTYQKRYVFDKDSGRVKGQKEALDEDQEKAMLKEFAAYHKLKHDLLIVPNEDYRDVSKAYRVGGIPHAVLIDRQGMIRLVRVGATPENAAELEEEIRKLLAQK